MVANDGYGVYEIIVAFAHIAFVALLLGSALTNIFRFPWFLYADEPRPAVQHGVGIAELLLAAVVAAMLVLGARGEARQRADGGDEPDSDSGGEV